MKRIIALFIFSYFSVSVVSAQYYVNIYNFENRNPADLNKDFETAMQSGYQTIFPFWQTPRNIYFPWRNLPFPFVIGTDTVNQFRVSNSGMVSFTSGQPPAATNGLLPSSTIPNKTIAIWGLEQKGGNDVILGKVFGNTPNRQQWIYFHSLSESSTNVNGDCHWAVVLCEGNNHIYIVDMGSYDTPHLLTAGIQLNDTTAVQLRQSPVLSTNVSSNRRLLTHSDNSFYEFIPGSRKQRDLHLSKIEMPTFLKVGQNFTFDIRYRDLSSSLTDSICFSYQEIGTAAVYTDTVYLNNPTNQFYRTQSIPSKWTPQGGERNIDFKFWIHDGKGVIDENTTNDTLYKNVLILPTNRWPKRHLLESFESAALSAGTDSKLNMNFAFERNEGLIGIAWHSDSAFVDSMSIKGTDQLASHFQIIHPEATINRNLMPSVNSINLIPSEWSMVSDSLGLSSSSCKIELFGNSSNNQVQFSTRITFTDTINNKPKRVSVLLIEDSVIGIGSGYDQVNFFDTQYNHPFWNLGNPVTNYYHRKVVRDVWPKNKVWGEPNIIPANTSLNTPYLVQNQFSIPPGFNINNLTMVVIVTNHTNNDRSIINAIEKPINSLITTIPSKNKNATKMLVYPNPVNDFLNIRLPNSLVGSSTCRVFNLSGKQVLNKNLTNFKIEIDLSSLSNGVYILEVKNGSKTYRKKILKK